MGGAVEYIFGRGDTHTVFWLENLRERDLMEDIGVDGRKILKWILKKWYGAIWTGYTRIWLRIRTGGGFL
jgi:hypothetical protein